MNIEKAKVAGQLNKSSLSDSDGQGSIAPSNGTKQNCTRSVSLLDLSHLLLTYSLQARDMKSRIGKIAGI